MSGVLSGICFGSASLKQYTVYNTVILYTVPKIMFISVKKPSQSQQCMFDFCASFMYCTVKKYFFSGNIQNRTDIVVFTNKRSQAGGI